MNPFSNGDHATVQDEELNLLDILLENTQLYNNPTWHDLPALSSEAIVALAPVKQARYYFLLGLIAQQKADFSAARRAFERALVLAPGKYHPAILDELGRSYFVQRAYHTALDYHKRALQVLEKEVTGDTKTALHFKLELHCADDYRALGAYREACEHYERARLLLSSEHDMKTAGLLYLGLGYCTYAFIYQASALFLPSDFAELERQFQHAITFLVQSKSVYQVSGDQVGVATVRLTLAMVLLDFSTRRRQLAQVRAAGKKLTTNCAILLDEAEEECRQVLLSWQEADSERGSAAGELETILYVALAYLIRVYIQRAKLARLEGYGETALRERALAAYLCQQMLESFPESSLLWNIIRHALTLQSDRIAFRLPALPQQPEQPDVFTTPLHNPISQLEAYFAVAELTEEIGASATAQDYARDCYARANQYLEAALPLTRSAGATPERDPGYIFRFYQRCVLLLEERSVASSNGLREETNVTLLKILKDGFYHAQFPIPER
jgi:tetratricopeptide (TPR) repeat protein